MGLLGYVPYVAFVILPGLGAGELFNVWKIRDDFTARVGYALGLGIGIDTIVLVVRTAGVTSILKGVDTLTVFGTILAGGTMLLISILVRGRFNWFVRPRRIDIAILGIVLLQAVIIWLYFQKYPIYPDVFTDDLSNHIRNTLGLIAGTNTSVPRGVLYDGVYYQLAPSILLVGGNVIAVVRLTMAILTLFSPFIFYLVTLRLSGSQTCALIVVFVYVISAPIWFQMVFILGLYANFFGIMAALFLVVAFLDMVYGSAISGALFALIVATALIYYSHYSAVTLFPAILAFPFVANLVKKGSVPLRRSLVALTVLFLPGAVGFALYEHIIARIFLADKEAVPLTGSSALSSLFSAWPFLSYMIYRMISDLSFIAMTILACVFLWKFVSTRAVLFIIPVIWIVTIAATAPFDVTAWRYSIEAYVPFTVMAGTGIYFLLPKPRAGKGRQNPRSFYWKVALVLVLVIPWMVIGWGGEAVTDAATNTALSAQTQVQVNQSITWLGQNTPKNATYLSVSNILYIYARLQIGREGVYYFESEPTDALQYAAKINATYIVVTSVSSTYQPAASDYPWNSFPANGTSSLLLVYQNPGVRIYKIT